MRDQVEIKAGTGKAKCSTAEGKKRGPNMQGPFR